MSSLLYNIGLLDLLSKNTTLPWMRGTGRTYCKGTAELRPIRHVLMKCHRLEQNKGDRTQADWQVQRSQKRQQPATTRLWSTPRASSKSGMAQYCSAPTLAAAVSLHTSVRSHQPLLPRRHNQNREIFGRHRSHESSSTTGLQSRHTRRGASHGMRAGQQG